MRSTVLKFWLWGGLAGALPLAAVIYLTRLLPVEASSDIELAGGLLLLGYVIASAIAVLVGLIWALMRHREEGRRVLSVTGSWILAGALAGAAFGAWRTVSTWTEEAPRWGGMAPLHAVAVILGGVLAMALFARVIGLIRGFMLLEQGASSGDAH